MKLSVVVPCYNEEENIPLVLERFAGIIKRDDVEVILVDNGSLDNTRQVLDEHLPKYFFARKATVKINQGYSYGVLSGLKEAVGEFIGWTHADMQTDPYDLLRALEIMEKRSDSQKACVKGLRKSRGFLDTFFTIGMGCFETLYFMTKLWDVNAQPNVFHRSFYHVLKEAPSSDFALDLYALYKAKEHKLDIVRMPVVFTERAHGVSSWNFGLLSKWKYVVRVLNYSRNLKKRFKKQRGIT